MSAAAAASGKDENMTQDLQDTTSFFDGRFTAQSVTIVICCALALYNALLLLMLIFITFRRFRGLYFVRILCQHYWWSLLIASFGIIPYVLGFMIEYFRLTAQVAGLVITLVGWPMMVTGQSFVLYSRLGVLMAKEHRRLLRGVKWMIVIDGIVFHTSTMVVVFGAYLAHPARRFQLAYRYIEKIQMTGFTIQELVISGLYVWRTLEILKLSSPLNRQRTRRVMWQLFSINVVIIVLDVALLVVEYQDRHVIEQAVKQVVYSVKLKFEFAILSKLAALTRRRDDQTYLGGVEDGDYDDVLAKDRDASVEGGRSRSQAWMCTGMLQGEAEGKGPPGGQHVERKASAGAEDEDREAAPDVICCEPSTATVDQQHRRRTLDEDLYAGVCKDLAG
ncbi:hypothetical protein LTR53_004336 [Teratosphaeriaceae sp. CCFEE 6253]|nr:hypothetical protein LTR53_004336 [Teratosphaeriaceae sp. CCFEE 6253]